MKASAGSAAQTRATGTKAASPAPKTTPPAAGPASLKPAQQTGPAPAEARHLVAAARAAEAKPRPAAKAAPAAKPAVKAAPPQEPEAEALAPAARPGFAAPTVESVVPPPAAAIVTSPVAPQAASTMADRRPPDRTPAPRAHAKQETFVEGDHVVYPTHGVGKVERIATEEIAGHKLELIHITFEENRMTLRVPVTKAPAAGLRKLATRKMFDEALAVLKGRARIKRTMWSRRAQEYEAKINSGDPLAIAEVVRDLHRNAGQPDQSFSERQIYEAAMDRLAAELAALDKTDKATASEKLTNFLKTIT